jgi:hypothetical protein
MENSQNVSEKARSGFFFTYNDQIRSQISDEDFAKFSKLTKDEDRVDFICQLTVDNPIVTDTPLVCKDQQLAANLKKVGNAHFQNGKWKEALKFYSESLLQTPKENGKRVKIR